MIATLKEDQHLLICNACGTQFDTDDAEKLKSCRICDDPRQFIPPTGQSFTTLKDLWNGGYSNKTERDSENSKLLSIVTEPKFAIGQRACLIQTEYGNVLWDCVTYIDQDTIDMIEALGGLRAIVISHPHYYSTHLVWAKVFGCSVYTCAEDEEWFCRSPGTHRILLRSEKTGILGGIVAVRVGGHFPGSLVLYWEKKLFIADSIVTVPSGLYHHERPPGTTSYGFYWSIPNMIPLPPDEIRKIWIAIKDLDFETTHGAFLQLNIRDRDLDDAARSEGKTTKWKVKESMRIQISHMGFNHGTEFLDAV